MCLYFKQWTFWLKKYYNNNNKNKTNEKKTKRNPIIFGEIQVSIFAVLIYL